jgi:hypothetical protein
MQNLDRGHLDEPNAAQRQTDATTSDLLEWLWSRYETADKRLYGDILWVFMMLELWHTNQYDRIRYAEPELISAGPQAK